MNDRTKEKVVKITVCLPQNVAEDLRRIAKETGYKISKIVEKGAVLALLEISR